MVQKLKFIHRLKIGALAKKRKFPKLVQYLEKVSGVGFDVAAIPFQLLDDLLPCGSAVEFKAIMPLARFTIGGQPRLLTAILDDLSDDTQDGLRQIVSDATAHPMTRFEAMGWATYLANRAALPRHGRPVGDVFQFWDHPDPPSEIVEGKRLWQGQADNHVWYDDSSARQYIAEGFGQDAARAYAELWHPALKSDVFRLFRLAKDGGVYCDADSRPEHRASEFLKLAGDRVWASSMTNVPNCVANNWFIAAPAGTRLIEALLEQVLRNIRDVGSRGIFWLSGPGAFTGFLYRSSGQYDIGLLSQGHLKSELFRQFDARYKHTEQNWRVYEHNRDLGNEAGLKQVLIDGANEA